MVGAILKTMTESMMDGETVGETFFYQILNIVKNRIESSRLWRQLVTEDSSNTTASSDTFETYHSLPTDFGHEHEVRVGTDGRLYTPVPFEMRHSYRNSAHHYYIDLVNSRFALMGNQVGGETIYFYYGKISADIASGTEWVFPDRFHPVLAFETALYIQSAPEFDEINIKMTPEQGRQAKMLKDELVYWDTNLWMKVKNHSFDTQQSGVGKGTFNSLTAM